ncbi:HTTM domain-containing protein [Flavobacterium sp. N502540]|uniref:HTTM domain-containing protein n=1 Tax=Flavobacterium sp. N502540 TaxID=2986838 RepID=UPI00222427D3|nr:HTTM domain-containing protein [Flavobacterium sp. N502540]
MPISIFYKLTSKFFNFIEVEKPTYPLFFFRVGLSMICIGKFVVLKSNFNEFYGQYGLIQWSISKLSNYNFLPHIGNIVFALSKCFSISHDQATTLLLELFFCACCFLMIGLFTRISTVICFFLHLAFINTGNGFIYGVDVFTQLALFYGMFFPLNATYSIDSSIGISKFKKTSVWSGISIRMIQIQMCIVYLSTGIEKSLGKQWLNGEAIWRTLMMPIFKTYDFSWISNYPFIPVTLGIFVLIIEIGYSVFIWYPKTRTIWYIFIILLHINIGVIMGMWFFAFVMIFLNTFAFGSDVLNDIRSKSRSGNQRWFLSKAS